MKSSWAPSSLTLLLILSATCLLTLGTALAEPWLGNRYAQNCAGCHSPGRKNLPPASRRCTLACQGCHVSPSGGGLRSPYGKWTEDRWLRSFKSDMLAHADAPVPSSKQPWGKNKNWKKASKALVTRGALVETTPALDIDERKYDKSDRIEHITAKSKREWLYQISKEDPYRVYDDTKIDGGVDVRWQLVKYDIDTDASGESFSSKYWANFLMTADVGIRWRPAHRRFHLVYEGRAVGTPTAPNKIENTAAAMGRRSLYFMVDDLPYNLYVMGGYFRPLFGTLSPDHTTLQMRMISQALQGNNAGYNLYYEALAFGGSPNVPYGNLYVISKRFGANPNETNKGFAANLGGRFVSFGASFSYSYWRTSEEQEVDSQPVEATVEMHAVGLGGQFGPTTVTLEATSITKDVPKDAYHEGGVYALETHTRLWRQIYATGSFYYANMSKTLSPGSSTMTRIGGKAFLFPGMEFQLAYTIESDTAEDTYDEATVTKTDTRGIIGQIHFFM